MHCVLGQLVLETFNRLLSLAGYPCLSFSYGFSFVCPVDAVGIAGLWVI